MRIMNGTTAAECSIAENRVSVTVTGYKIPLRVYATGEKMFYGGIIEPLPHNMGKLCFDVPFSPRRVLITDGRMEETHNKVFDFDFCTEDYRIKTVVPSLFDNEFEKQLFSQKSLIDCIGFYGHYIVFKKSERTVYAFPSDFFAHPLLQFLPYSFWYDVDLCGRHRGYYVIAETGGRPEFVNYSELLLMNKSSHDRT